MAKLLVRKQKEGYIYDGGHEEKIIAQYENGNYKVILGEFGTKIRENDLDNLTPSFPENIDIKVTNKCTGANCSFCHENSSEGGFHGRFNYNFLNTLRPGTELALGGGNIFEHPFFEDFLVRMKSIGVIANITVNQIHLTQENLLTVNRWQRCGYIYGVGVSWNGRIEGLRQIYRNLFKPQNMVIHTIAGIHNLSDLYSEGFKVLILGYKNLRRGAELFAKQEKQIMGRIEELREKIINDDFFNKFELVSFDNLAIEQLRMKEVVDREIWDTHYMGDDGTFTMYIDLVKGEFASNSTSMTRYSLDSHESIDSIFETVLKEK